MADTVTGTVVASYAYDSYGQLTQTQGTLSQPYAYTGREYDPESGLYHYRARAYDPTNGVFLQVDPIEFRSGSLGLYAALDANPIYYNDPTGNSVVSGPYRLHAKANGLMTGVVSGGIAGATIFLATQTGKALTEFANDLSSEYPGYGNNGYRDPDGSKCEAAKQRVKAAKNLPNLRSCKGFPDRYTAGLRAAAWFEMGVARAQRDSLCTDGPKGDKTYGGEMVQASTVWKNWGVCLAVTAVGGL